MESDGDWETDADYENPHTSTSSVGRTTRKQLQPSTNSTCTIRVCTNGACCRDGARATLVELEELYNHVGDAGRCAGIVEINCFGLCGRGPNVSIDTSDGRETMNTGVRSTKQSIDIIQKATGKPVRVSDALATRLRELRCTSKLEQALAEAQEIVDVLDISSAAARASAACQAKYDRALALVDGVLKEAPAAAHPRRLAEAVRRQVVAERSGRPVSPEVEDVRVDEPETWPNEDRVQEDAACSRIVGRAPNP